VPDFELTKPHTAKVYRVLKNSLQAKANKQRNTKMKPSLKQSPCHAHESSGEEGVGEGATEETHAAIDHQGMPPSTTRANHVDRPFHL
jgi:hypothetical protein